MADTAFQTQYRQEFIATFEAHESLLRESVTTEVEIKGNTATFLVAGTGGATAVTRGVNGLIPSRSDSLTQTSATLVEWHDKVNKSGFNIFASQGNQRAIMQMTSAAVINRKIDDDIITILNTGTQDTGATAQASLQMVIRSKVILQQNGVPDDGNIWAVVSPGFIGYLSQATEFSSADYTTRKPLDSGDASWTDKSGYYKWQGINFVSHIGVPGVGTSAEKCFMYHKSALGHAVNSGGIMSAVGYNEEDDYSFARTSIYMGSVLLQNAGVVVMNHDSSAWAAE